MNKGTVKTIIILIGLLFLNIEAAHAGLIGKLKVYIHHEFTDLQFFYLLLTLGGISFLMYVIFTPVVIGKKKWNWLTYYSYAPGKPNFQHKRETIRKIEEILASPNRKQFSH